MPVLELARRVTDGGLPPGTTVHLLSDDPAAAVDVPAWCQMRGHVYLGSVGGSADPDGVAAAGPDPVAGGYSTYMLRLGD